MARNYTVTGTNAHSQNETGLRPYTAVPPLWETTRNLQPRSQEEVHPCRRNNQNLKNGCLLSFIAALRGYLALCERPIRAMLCPNRA